MRMMRIISSVVTAAVAVALVAAAGPAQAEDPGQGTGKGRPEQPMVRMQEAAPESSVGLVAPRRSISSRVVSRGSRLVLRGDVEDYDHGKVLVQRRACEDCKWKRHDVVTTGGRGWFRSRIDAPRRGSTWWRAKVRASDGYTQSFSAVWETYY